MEKDYRPQRRDMLGLVGSSDCSRRWVRKGLLAVSEAAEMKRTTVTTILCLVLGVMSALALLLLLEGGSRLTEAQGPDGISIYYVALGGSCGTGISPCYATVQAAVDAADDPGDVIKVAAGTYTGVQARPSPSGYYGPGGVLQVVYVSKTVTIWGGYTTADWTTSDPEANPTTLDAQGQGRVLFVSGDIAPTIVGLQLTNGDATWQGGDMGGMSTIYDAGGGVYVRRAAVTLAGNQVFSNTAWHGGGLYVNGDWTDNRATIEGNTVFSNAAASEGEGGGLWAGYGDVTISDNTIRDNVAGYRGGGLFVIPVGHSASLRSNAILSNTAGYYGGGVCLWLFESGATVDGNSIMTNVAGYEGGGLYLSGSDATLINNVIADNQANTGSGLYLASSSTLVHNTLACNVGGSGIYANQTAVLSNTILVSHTVGIAGSANMEATLWGSGVWANGTDWSGSIATGMVNLWADPAFVDPDNRDYHISGTSPAREAGIDAGVDHDVDGQVRPMDWAYDIGADEYPGVGLEVVKHASEALVRPGDLVTYTIVVTSAGGEDATGVILTDTLDGWQQPVSANSSLGSCSLLDGGWGGIVGCSPGTVVAGANVVVTLTAQVSTVVPLGHEMVNTVVVTANETANSAQATIYAQDCYVRINDGPTEYTTVQAAVDVADLGDVVKVAGYCAGVNEQGGLRQQVYLDKSLTVRGGYTTANWSTPDPEANPTTLDALGLGRAIYVSGDPSAGSGQVITPTVEGLRITGGDASGLGGHPLVDTDAGSGVYIADAMVTIQENHVFGNAHTGIFVLNGSATIMDNHIYSNTQIGIELNSCTAAIVGNVVFSNTNSGSGGGIYAFDSDTTIRGNTIMSNTANSGAGMFAYQGMHVIEGNHVVANTATGTNPEYENGGGGVYLSEVTDASLLGNTIQDNTAYRSGGGVYFYSETGDGDIALINNVIADNEADTSGSGVYIATISPRFVHNTVARNTGGDGAGIYVMGGSTADLANTILVSHTVGIYVSSDSEAEMETTLWGDGAWANGMDWDGDGSIVTGTVNVWGDSAFIDADGGDYHIGEASAARDAGVDAGITADMDGQPRPMGLGHDIGADEYPAAGLDLVKLASGTFLRPGQLVTYTIPITSMGMADAVGVLLTDTFDVWQQPVSVVASAGSCEVADGGWGGVVTCELGTIALSSSVVVTVTGQVSETVPMGQRMENVVDVTADDRVGGSAQVEMYAQDCSVRINDDPTEYATVQAAVDAAAGGDLVKVAGYCVGAGEREGERQQVYLDKSLALRGGYTITNWTTPDPEANPTTLDALGQGRVFSIVGDFDATVEGLQITGGSTEGDGGGVHVVNCHLTFRGNTLISNSADNGGAISLHGVPNATLSDNTVSANTADSQGGGVYLESCWVTFIGNTVSGNSAEHGSGVYLFQSYSTLSGNVIYANTASGNGGGVSLVQSPSTLSGNVIYSNTASSNGGGLYLEASDATLINNIVADNSITGQGSGVYVYEASPQFVHNTIARNTGGNGTGVHLDRFFMSGYNGNVDLTNTILVSQSVGIDVSSGYNVTMEATLWGSGDWANGTDWSGTVSTGTINVWGDPAFLDPDNANYHIGEASAAREAGVDAGVTDDIDGDPRPMGHGYDLGADEFRISLAVSKRAMSSVVQAGGQLTYTLCVTNTGDVDLHTTITDTLPDHVTSAGPLTWTPILVPDEVWEETVVVTVETGYSGVLANTVQVTTEEGASGDDTAACTSMGDYYIYLPVVMRRYP